MVAHATGLEYLNKESLPLMWCPGCGHGIILGALLRAFEELQYRRNEIVVVTGIGCWGKADDYIKTNALHTTHGRALAYATGVKAANPNLKVVVLMGDGDGATIGGNHLIHAARRNMDLTAILANNMNYGMTGGQYSATTPANSRTSTSIYGNPENEFDICKLVDAAGANYVARETVFNGVALKNHIKEALNKKGFSLVEAIGPCTTLFGPNNKMKQSVAMLKWLTEKAVPISKYNQLEESARNGSFAVGKFTDRDAPDFGTRYHEIQQRLQGGEK